MKIPTKSSEEKANELVWHFYSTMEHRLSDEYSPFDWNICVELATKVVDEILEFMKNDDEIHEDTHFANSPWITYWYNVKDEINKFKK
jgi:hypothetical protein